MLADSLSLNPKWPMVMGLQGPGSLVVTGSSFSLLHISYLLWELGGLPPGMGYWATGAMGYWATGLRTDWATGWWANGLLG